MSPSAVATLAPHCVWCSAGEGLGFAIHELVFSKSKDSSLLRSSEGHAILILHAHLKKTCNDKNSEFQNFEFLLFSNLSI